MLAAKRNGIKYKFGITVTIKYIAAAFLFFALSFTLLKFPKQTSDGVRHGLLLCASTVVPSLFPFMVVSDFFAQTGLFDKIGKLLEKPTRFLFRQPGVACPVILLSAIGGFPVGAKLIKQLYESQSISKQHAQRLLIFCINPGPAFVISCVGSSMLKSEKAGLIIFISIILSSFILGVLTRFTYDEQPLEKITAEQNAEKPSVSSALVHAATQSTSSIIAICGWVVIFAVISELLKTVKLSEEIRLFFDCILEVTNGCEQAAGVLAIPIIAGIIGWSGLCVHCQVMQSVIAVSLPIKYFITGRIINGAFAVIICQTLLNIFPVQTQAVFINSQEISANMPVCVPVSIGLLIMCALLLLGNNFTIGKRKRQDA